MTLLRNTRGKGERQMALYQRGSKGAEVAKIQTRLQQLGFYTGPIDSDFGGGTESAVKGFQKQQDRKSTRLNSSHSRASRMPSSA